MRVEFQWTGKNKQSQASRPVDQASAWRWSFFLRPAEVLKLQQVVFQQPATHFKPPDKDYQTIKNHTNKILLTGTLALGISQICFAFDSEIYNTANSAQNRQTEAPLILAVGAGDRVDRRSDRRENTSDRVEDKQEFREERRDCVGEGANCRSDNRQDKRQDTVDRAEDRVDDRRDRR